jgi:hypothetical protein
MKLIFQFTYFLLFLNLSQQAFAQQNSSRTTVDPQTGVQVTTFVIYDKPLAQEVAELEQQVALARQNPQYVQDGTLAKYEQALAEKRQALAAEQQNQHQAQPRDER